ncbi:MAG: IclR family transcriptional regulator [bacterium]
MVKKNKQDYTVQSVCHAIDILEAFSGNESEFGVTELSRKLSLPKNNIFRLLATLKSRGYIEKNETSDNYRLGIRVFELGQIFQRRMGLLKQAHPVMEDLQLKINESVYLAILQETDVVYIDLVETTHSVRIVSRLGRRAPAYCTSVGKIMLAYESNDEISRFFNKVKLDHEARNTIQDRKTLCKCLGKIEKQGYAIDDEEFEEEVRCVAAPVFDYTRRVVAGIGITGPLLRMSPERIKNELVPLVKDAGKEISRRLGYWVEN